MRAGPFIRRRIAGRAAALLAAAGVCASLCGCAALPRRSAGLEDLLVVQVLGVDGEGEELRLSMATAADSARGEGPVRLKGGGRGMRDAAQNIGALVTDEELMCAHSSHLLVGEQSARSGIDPLLRYVFRSPELRTDIKLYIVRGGSAEDAVLLSGDGRVGAAELLDAMSDGPRPRAGEVRSVARTAAQLGRSGCALAAAVSLVPSSEQGEDGELLTLARSGCAVLKDGRLVGFIEQEELPALACLLGESGEFELVVTGPDGRPVTLVTGPARTRLEPIRGADGALKGAEISVELGASVAETPGETGMSAEACSLALSEALEEELLRRAERVLRLRRELGADFLFVADRVAAVSSPAERAADAALGARAAELPITLSVDAAIELTGDLRDGR